jgi:hypothetical protein
MPSPATSSLPCASPKLHGKDFAVCPYLCREPRPSAVQRLIAVRRPPSAVRPLVAVRHACTLPSVITAAHGKVLWLDKKKQKMTELAARIEGLSLPEEAHRREVGRGKRQVREGGVLRAAHGQGGGWPRRAVEVGPTTTATNRKSSGRPASWKSSGRHSRDGRGRGEGGCPARCGADEELQRGPDPCARRRGGGLETRKSCSEERQRGTEWRGARGRAEAWSGSAEQSVRAPAAHSRRSCAALRLQQACVRARG